MDPFSYSVQSDPSEVPIDLLPALVTLVRSEKLEDVLQGVMLLRKLLSVGGNPHVFQIVQTEIAPVLATYMTHDSVNLQSEASRALSHIATGHKDLTQVIINLGVVPLWYGHLLSCNDECQEQAAWAIGNIAVSGLEGRDYLLEHGAMQRLIDVICKCGDGNDSMLVPAVWALSNLCRSKPQPAIEHVMPALAVLVTLINHPAVVVVIHTMWALAFISDGPANRVQVVVNSGVVPKVVQRLSSVTTEFHMPAIRIIGNICAGSDPQCLTAINAGCLPLMKLFLVPETPRDIRKEAAWLLSNVASGNPHMIQAIIDAGLLPFIISSVGAPEVELQEEAVWTCANISANGSSQQIGRLIECGALKVLCEMLSRSDDDKILIPALETVRTMLECGAEQVQLGQCNANPLIEQLHSCGGSQILEILATHSNPNIQGLALEVLLNYFDPRGATQPHDGAEQLLPTKWQEEDDNATTEDFDGKEFWHS